MSSDAFSKFGIKHLSHSSLDLARHELPLWVLRYLYKVYGPSNCAMERGKAVEHGCQIFHTGSEFDDPADEALKQFNKATALGFDGDARQREAANIPGMVEQYVGLFDEVTPLEAYQRKIEVEIPGVPVPVIGFTDFEFEDAIVDLKTTTRLPSAISAAHRRQGAIYSRASGNRAVDFIYVTPKKAARYALENSDQDWIEVCEAARRLMTILDQAESREDLAARMIPDFDSFYWSSPSTRESAREIYGY